MRSACSGGIPGPSSWTARITRLPALVAVTTTSVPDGVWESAFAISARPIWSTRSSSATAQASGSASTVTACPVASASGASSSASSRAMSASDTSSRSTRSRPASMRERSSRSAESFVSRSTCSRVVARNPARVSSSRSSSAISSRKPASENSGVRSSCDAFATNSLRAVSSCASWTRMRSNAAASSPSSSPPRSTTGSSNSPCAMRLAARSRRRMRRAWSDAAAPPRIAAIASATPVAYSSRRFTTRTVASWSSIGVERSRMSPEKRGTATSANGRPRRSTRPRATLDVRAVSRATVSLLIDPARGDESATAGASAGGRRPGRRRCGRRRGTPRRPRSCRARTAR